jgi:hypothetical protein
MGDTMSTLDPFSAPHLVDADTCLSQRSAVLRRLWSRAAAWLETCARYRAAAALYEELSRLSDAELARRGLDRASLARDAVAVRDADVRQQAD